MARSYINLCCHLDIRKNSNKDSINIRISNKSFDLTPVLYLSNKNKLSGSGTTNNGYVSNYTL